MRRFFFVLFALILHLFLCVCKADELMGVQAFDPEVTVEGRRLAGPGEVERDPALVGPKIQLA